MVTNPFVSDRLVGRQAELQQVCQILAADGDLLLAGVPGNGRRTLLRFAMAEIGSRMIEIDCLRAIDSNRLLQLLAEAILTAFPTSADLAFMQQWSQAQPVIVEKSFSGQTRLTWHLTSKDAPKDAWSVFQSLLALPQFLAEALNCRVVVVFLNFPHLRSWDRTEKWQTYLRQEIQQQSRVSYALIATVAERSAQHTNLQVVFLGPLQDAELQLWAINTAASVGLQFEPDSPALRLFLRYVQGHFGDAIALLRRIWMDYRVAAAGNDLENMNRSLTPKSSSAGAGQQVAIDPRIQVHQVHRSALALVEDLSVTYESLILLLPPSQVRVLESLALDPTQSPHAREYIQKHQLSRGGGLQGALSSLEQKGLVYGSEYSYRITLPLLAFWLTQRLA